MFIPTDTSVAGGAVIADTAPAHAQGKLWWESDTGILWLSYNDGSSTQWVSVGGLSVTVGSARQAYVHGVMVNV